jgi:hypothetical protein
MSRGTQGGARRGATQGRGRYRFSGVAVGQFPSWHGHGPSGISQRSVIAVGAHGAKHSGRNAASDPA